MEYENVDEASRREACERVKQIVEAIKTIKIKYYPGCTNISKEDQEIYQKLQDNLEKISKDNNLQTLVKALMADVNAKYDRNDDGNGSKDEQVHSDILQACYGAIDAEKEALSRGRIRQALRCKEQFKKYKQELNPDEVQEVINYKREKFAELMQSIEQTDKQNKYWRNQLKGRYKIKDTQKRQQAMQIISELQYKEPIKDAEEEIITM